MKKVDYKTYIGWFTSLVPLNKPIAVDTFMEYNFITGFVLKILGGSATNGRLSIEDDAKNKLLKPIPLAYLTQDFQYTDSQEIFKKVVASAKGKIIYFVFEGDAFSADFKFQLVLRHENEAFKNNVNYQWERRNVTLPGTTLLSDIFLDQDYANCTGICAIFSDVETVISMTDSARNPIFNDIAFDFIKNSQYKELENRMFPIDLPAKGQRLYITLTDTGDVVETRTIDFIFRLEK